MTRIAFQGEPGAFSHQGCRTWFPDHEPVACATFEEAFDAVRSGDCALALIPVDNALAGRVSDVHHLLPKSGLKIIGERFLPIHMQLMANAGATLDTIKVVESHAMALGQCRKAIAELKLKPEVVYDTAGAAKRLAAQPDPRRAVIAGAIAAELYGLTILRADVEDAHWNTTRFLVMTADQNPAEPPAGTPAVTSFVFRVRNVPAALYKALGGFATNGVNMTKLESYMENGAFTATFFYAEVDGRPDDPSVRLAMEELSFFSSMVEVLGVFPEDPFRKQPR
jgi:prephenate dehydratase